MKNFFANLFSVNTGQARAIIIVHITILLFLLTGYWGCWRNNQPNRSSEIVALADSITRDIETKEKEAAKPTPYQPKITETKSAPKKTTKPKCIARIDINQADAAAFKQFSGIGTKLSKRIVNFRDALGGYHSVDQLKEVYGLDAAIVNKYYDCFIVTKNAHATIDLNTVDVKTASHHPYISYKKARKIEKLQSKYDLQKGYLLIELGIFTQEELDKIRPYLVLVE